MIPLNVQLPNREVQKHRATVHPQHVKLIGFFTQNGFAKGDIDLLCCN